MDEEQRSAETEELDQGTEDKAAERTYTEDEMQLRIQAEADRRVAQALAKQKKDFEKSAKSRTTVTKLDEEERAATDKDEQIRKLQEELTQRNTEKARADLRVAVTSRGLPTMLADLMMLEEEPETVKSNLDAIADAFKKTVQEEVKRRMAASPPKDGAGQATVTREAYRKMTLAQQADLYAKTPELYKKLTAD